MIERSFSIVNIVFDKKGVIKPNGGTIDWKFGPIKQIYVGICHEYDLNIKKQKTLDESKELGYKILYTRVSETKN